MLSKLMSWVSNRLQHAGRWLLIIKLLIFLTIISPIVFVIYHNTQQNIESARNVVISERGASTHLAATLLKGKFDGYVGLATALSSQPDIRENIQAGNWDLAMDEFVKTQKVLPDIDGILLFDPSGQLMAGTPPIPEILNENFAFRDYFKGVTGSAKPYVSDVYTRAQDPKYNITAVAVPIFAPAISDNNPQTIGIILFTIKLDSLLSWAQQIELGTNGFAYFVDRKGNVAGHPKYADSGRIINYAALPTVEQVIKGRTGVEVLYNPFERDERLFGFEQVETYGWSAITEQPTNDAFFYTSTLLRQALIEDILLAIVSAILLIILIQIVFTVHTLHQKERIFLDSVGDGLIGIGILRSGITPLPNSRAGPRRK